MEPALGSSRRPGQFRAPMLGVGTHNEMIVSHVLSVRYGRSNPARIPTTLSYRELVARIRSVSKKPIIGRKVPVKQYRWSI